MKSVIHFNQGQHTTFRRGYWQYKSKKIQIS